MATMLQNSHKKHVNTIYLYLVTILFGLKKTKQTKNTKKWQLHNKITKLEKNKSIKLKRIQTYQYE